MSAQRTPDEETFNETSGTSSKRPDSPVGGIGDGTSNKRPGSPVDTLGGAMEKLDNYVNAQSEKRRRMEGASDDDDDEDAYVDDRVLSQMRVFSARGSAAQWQFTKSNSRPWLSVSALERG